MTLRAGVYDASRPRWRAVIRNDGVPWYVCTHDHTTPQDAKTCAKSALPELKNLDPVMVRNEDLLSDWRIYNRAYHSGL